MLDVVSLRESFLSLSVEQKLQLIESLPDEEAHVLLYDWELWARPKQLLPAGDWSYWLILAGRGFGKTRTGAEVVRGWAKTHNYVNLVGATRDDAREIMIEGESGLLAVCPYDERPDYKKHESKLVWPNGHISLIFTADEPERLRGKQHAKLWCDEVCSWRYPEAWDQAKFGLRLGMRPQAVITTTPKPKDLIRQLRKDPDTLLTTGTTYENRDNLAPTFYTSIISTYEGTRLGRQELNAEVLDDTPGALWTRKNLDDNRVRTIDLPEMKRVVVAIDPAVSTEERSDETGIVCAGLGVDNRGYVLADDSGQYSPDEWARRAIALYRQYEADVIVGEKNQGGDMVKHTVHSQWRDAPFKLVHASRGKVLRAEPISALYEQGKVSHVGTHDLLEDQMCQMTVDFDRKKQGYSPDRVDANVWALSELFPQMVKKSHEPEKLSQLLNKKFSGGGGWMSS